MSALASTYVASALATPVLVERLRGGTAHRFRLEALDARHVVLGRRYMARVRRCVQRQPVACLAALGEHHLTLGLEHLADLGKAVAQVSDGGAAGHVIRECITWRLAYEARACPAGAGLRSPDGHRRPWRAGIRRSPAAAPRLARRATRPCRGADDRGRPLAAATSRPAAVTPGHRRRRPTPAARPAAAPRSCASGPRRPRDRTPRPGFLPA